MLLWRISNHASLDGRGALIASARWHSQGHAVVYLAETPAGALVEALVHLELTPARFPKFYQLLKAEAPDNISVATLRPADLGKNWVRDETATQTLGDQWLDGGQAALLRVPSAIVPETFNVLLNPRHRDAAMVRVLWHEQYPWDSRLLL
jgi:RES domain-containing protein